MGPRPALIVIALAGVADADKHTAKYASSENIHLAGRRGAINRRHSIAITLDLHANGKAKAIDGGFDRDHNLYEDGRTTEDKVVWTNKWSGTWKKTGDTLAVTLALDDRSCTKTKTYDRGTPTTEPCRTIAKQLALACTSEKVDLESWSGSTKKLTPTPVWRCDAGDVELAETPRSWLFGKTACIEISDGRSAGMILRACGATP